MIDQLLETLKNQRKEVLAYLVLKLMESGKLAFSDIVEAHVKHIEMLERLQSEELMKLRGKLSVLWCDHKKMLASILHRSCKMVMTKVG